MPLETPARVVDALTRRGYNAEREAVTLLADAPDPEAAVERVVDAVPDEVLVVTADHVRTALDAPRDSGTTADPSDPAAGRPPDADGRSTTRDADAPAGGTDGGDVTADRDTSAGTDGRSATGDPTVPPSDPPVSTGAGRSWSTDDGRDAPVETEGSRDVDRAPSAPAVDGDVTGRSTGTGEYEDFVALFRDRYERLAGQLRGRVNPRPAEAVDAMPGGEDAAMIGMVSDVRTTASGHRLVELEDTTGTFPCLVMKDRAFADDVETMLTDEVVAVEGTLADDGGILFVDDLQFPGVPRTNRPSTADRPVSAALISDVHVGSQEFVADAWERFADWLHTPEAARVEYLLIAGDMVEGVGVYPGQDEELDVVDVYEQYERFAQRLKSVPGDIEIVMIPGNHDAVRLAEPQPAFDEELRSIMSAHDARVVGNPATVTIEGVSVLMYHGVSLDELIAEFPDEEASYEHPHHAMEHLLRKRHLAPKYGGHMRLAPESRDYLVIEEVPDVFHTGHVHKLGYGSYRNVLTINSGCWQAQTDFQESVNIDPDVATAPIVDLDTLDLTVREFR